MMKVLFLCFILTSTFTGAFCPSFSPHHRILIKFEEGSHGNTKVSILQPKPEDGFGFGFTFDKFKCMLASAVRKAGDKTIEVIGKAKTEVVQTIGTARMADRIEGALKDSVVKLEEWDPVNSPKRIGEDIGHNASVKIEQGVEEVKETVENVMETSPNELLTRSKNVISDIIDSPVRRVISWCYLLGFMTAYGMGVWVTFFSGCVLGKCLPKQQCAMVLNKTNMVYFRAMACCVGVALFGFLASQGTREGLSFKMEVFQGFNLVFALVMVLINLMFLEPQAAKFVAQRMKGTTSETKSIAGEKLKKINAYSSTLNVLTMVVLTWHLSYIGQLLQHRG